MIVIMGHARLAPGELDRLAEAARKQVEATRAEPGCLHYSFARDMLDPDTMLIAERWTGPEALQAHFAAPHMAEFNKAMAGAKVLDVRVVAYENGEERVLRG